MVSKKQKKENNFKTKIQSRKIEFEIFGQDNQIPYDFNPSKGTVKRAIVSCPLCGSVLDAKTTRKLFINKKSKERLIAVILKNPNKQGKYYRIANNNDLKVYEKFKEFLQKKKMNFLIDGK